MFHILQVGAEDSIHLRYVGVIQFVFYVLQLLQIIFHVTKLCCSSKSLMKHQQTWIDNWTSPYKNAVIGSAYMLIL